MTDTDTTDRPTITARGILRHHFWGDYRATLMLTVDRAEDLAPVMAALPAWKTDEAHPTVCGWHGGGAELDTQIEALVALGAKRKAINSCAHSIDHGDPFTITIGAPMVPSLFLPFDEAVTR